MLASILLWGTAGLAVALVAVGLLYLAHWLSRRFGQRLRKAEGIIQ